MPPAFALEAVLELKTGMTLKGAGIDRTVLTHAENWRPATTALPDPEMKLEGLNTDAYLIRLQRDTSGHHLRPHPARAAPHGAVFAWFHTGLHLHHVRFRNPLVRPAHLRHEAGRIHDCEFIDAGGRWERGHPGDKGGITGGGIFAVWMSDCEVNDNRAERTRPEPQHEFYGIKVRQSVRGRFHHNTIRTNFSMEFPFENDEDNEIDHNFLAGTVSIPKHAGGAVPASGRTFHIHHNLFRDTYSIRFVRNGVEIDHNLFDFDPARNHGNLISAFGQAPPPAPPPSITTWSTTPGAASSGSTRSSTASTSTTATSAAARRHAAHRQALRLPAPHVISPPCASATTSSNARAGPPCCGRRRATGRSSRTTG
ncbi:MAG: hypothetical protein U1F77_16000 [Kiritimatiellia bacterium]